MMRKSVSIPMRCKRMRIVVVIIVSLLFLWVPRSSAMEQDWKPPPPPRLRRLPTAALGISSFQWSDMIGYMLCVMLGIKPAGNTCPCGWKQARLTYYESYPQCCTEINNNNNGAECSDYSGCEYQGLFAYLPDQKKSLQWVKNHNVCALFSTHDDIDANYANQKIRIRKAGQTTFTCTVYDTCSDTDCDGCCTNNAGTSGYLLDMEYWTVLRHYKDLDAADGKVCFQKVPVA